jgi:hypothetical protein
MSSELSYLLSLNILDGRTVRNVNITDSVTLSYEFEREWLQTIKSRCPKVAARESLSPHPFTHRMYLESEEEINSDDLNGPRQRILQILALLRIVKPNSIGSSNVWVTIRHDGDNQDEYSCEVHVGFQSEAYPPRQYADENVIADDHVKRITTLIEPFRNLLLNEPDYRRVVRALKFYEIASHLYYAEFRHIIMHAALESLICVHHVGKRKKRTPGNRAQVTRRLPQVGQLTEDQATRIYDRCIEYKHTAAPLQRDAQRWPLAQADNERLRDSDLLEEALRAILLRAIRDTAFAKVLADPVALETAYPV